MSVALVVGVTGRQGRRPVDQWVRRGARTSVALATASVPGLT
ncbi:hypothetical protein ACFQ08_17825 [Streptosporangium algeriense]|uniref:NmrA family transcriptional regulator n=1 Tax=Streptosporangium algeriense TaxID=1682748 RepID=A0ABW3DTS2_9ACTN